MKIFKFNTRDNSYNNKIKVNFGADLQLQQVGEIAPTMWFDNNLRKYGADIIGGKGKILVTEVVKRLKKGNYCKLNLAYFDNGNKHSSFKQDYSEILPSNLLNPEKATEKFVFNALVDFGKKLKINLPM